MRNMTCAIFALLVFGLCLSAGTAYAKTKKPNIVVIWGDDIGRSNLSVFTKGMMGYHTPNIDRIAKEGILFTDAYADQSCTAGRSSFITGQSPFRTGLSKVGMPGAKQGISAEDPTLATLLKEQGYATAQFGKNHLGDRNEHLPTLHGFDEFYGAINRTNINLAGRDPNDLRNRGYRPGDPVDRRGEARRQERGRWDSINHTMDHHWNNYADARRDYRRRVGVGTAVGLGIRMTTVPRYYRPFRYGGVGYYYHDGVWVCPCDDDGYVTCLAPYGVVVPTMPTGP